MKPIRFITKLSFVLALSMACVPFTLSAQTATSIVPAAPPDAVTAPLTSDKKGGPVDYEGNITSIDLSTNTVTVASTTKLMILAITPSTKLRKNTTKARLTDFGLGDPVSGSYSKDSSGKLTAHSLRKNTHSAPSDSPSTASGH